MKKYSSLVAAVVLSFCFGVWLNTSNVVKAQTNIPASESEVALSGGSGYGTTGVYARTFTTVTANYGSDITYTSDSVNGDYFTINHSGLYAVSYSDGGGSSLSFGVSLNYAPTSAFSSAWGTGNELCAALFANSGQTCTAVVYLSSGDVLRGHAASNIGANVETITKFIVTKIK